MIYEKKFSRQKLILIFQQTIGRIRNDGKGKSGNFEHNSVIGRRISVHSRLFVWIQVSFVPLWRFFILSGLTMLCFGLFAYLDKPNRRIWGALILLYSSIGFVPFGFLSEFHFLLPVTIAYLLGIVSSALALSSQPLEIALNP